MNLKIIQHKKTFFILSGILMLASILALVLWGFNLGIDFTGGSLLEVQIKSDQVELSAQDVREIIETGVYEIGTVQVQPAQDSVFLIRMQDLAEQRHQAVLSVLSHPTQIPQGEKWQGIDDIHFEVIENRFESIGPIIGQELKDKALWAIGITLIIIILFIAWSFRKVSKPVQSWKYGVGAVIALFHDILITTGVFAVLGHFLNYEVGILFVTALLTILGYSVNDTIVVYDRTRENLIYNPQDTFANTVNKSINETIGRSINTSLTTLLVLFALFFFGGTTISQFVLALIIGIICGSYSSIFVASALLTVWHKRAKK